MDSCNSGAGDARNGSALLHYVYSCLFAQKVSPKVCSCIMELTVNLLSDWDKLTVTDEQEQKTKEVMQNDVRTDESEARMDIGNRTQGSDLVLPFIPMLLGYMSAVIESERKRMKVTSEPINLCLEFTVISR